MSGDQLAGTVEVTGQNRVMDRLRDVARLEEPPGGPTVQVGDQRRFGDPELPAEQVAEQVVVAVPLPPGVEGEEEQVGALDMSESCFRVDGARDGITQRGAQPFEN